MGARRRRLSGRIWKWKASGKSLRTPGPLDRKEEIRRWILISAELTPKVLRQSQDVSAAFEKCWHQYPSYWMLMIHVGSECRQETQTIFQPSLLFLVCN